MGLIFQSVRFYWRSHLGVLLGVVLASAILTGSLLVGDSVDGSLRQVALQRLGNIESAMELREGFVAASLADRLGDDVAAVLQLRGMALADETQVNRVQVLGVDDRLGERFALELDEVALGKKLAKALGVAVGDKVSLRIEKPGLLPRDAPLSAQKESDTVRGRFTVRRVLGDDELGRFSLSANQIAPYNVFVSRAWLERRTELEGKANLLLAQKEPIQFKGLLTPADVGLRFRQVGDVVQLESERIYLGAEASRAAMSVDGAEGSLTYLVNSIGKGARGTPYSFVVAGGQGRQEAGGTIKINQWLADELDATVGDEVVMNYFELLPSNEFVEKARTFVVGQVVEMESLAAERELAPRFPGLTDVDRCAEWDAGFPMEEAQLEDEANEEYWNEFRQTPKAMVDLKTGQELFGNRFGNLTAVRWLGKRPDEVRDAFEKVFDPAAAGFVFMPVREQALAAVEQSMDFGQLFVGMSFFLIVAALMLTALLFVFGVEHRSAELGVLLAVGWSSRRVRRFVLGEGVAIALVGSVVGAWLGTGYTRLLLLGLSRYWEGAVANAAIAYFGSVETVAVGAASSFVCAVVAMWLAVRRRVGCSVRELLSGKVDEASSLVSVRNEARCLVYIGAFSLAAVALVVVALVSDFRSVTMPFFGAGALLLVSGILFCGDVLRRAGRSDRFGGLGGLALRNAGRRRGRSLSVIGLLACGCFMVFAVASMKEDVTAHVGEHGSGTGGFAWYGESTLPIKEDLGGVRLRVRDGDDASCLNLNHALEPKLLGVDPRAMSERRAFFTDEDVWKVLDVDLPEGMVPGLVGDADTAMWGLKKKVGVERGDVLVYRDADGQEFKVKLVGNLPMRLSVFQGSVLIAENDFVERYPAEGYRVFLLGAGGGERGVRQGRLEVGGTKQGLNVVPTVERLMEFYAVESTYLAMFLVLGVLGLMVGSLGMGVVVLRNVQDRRSEMAVLRAVGYRSAELRRVLFFEHGMLLAAGLGVGVMASSVAMVPSVALSGSRVSVGFNLLLFGGVVLCGGLCMALAVLTSLRGDALSGLRRE